MGFLILLAFAVVVIVLIIVVIGLIVNSSSKDKGAINVPKRFKRKVQTFDINVAGITMTSNRTRRSRVDILSFLEPYHPITLKHEPENEFDNQAILVLDSENNDLGYVPKNETKRIHRFWNEGNPMEAFIKKIKKSKEKPYCIVEVEVYKWITNE